MTDPDGDDHANEMEQEFISLIDEEYDEDENDYSDEAAAYRRNAV